MLHGKPKQCGYKNILRKLYGLIKFHNAKHDSRIIARSKKDCVRKYTIGVTQWSSKHKRTMF